MGLIQNKVTVSQPISHVVVKNAGGLKGATGEPGPAGQAATIAVGTTTTLPAGASATVQNSGTSSAAVFNFGIPKGEKGDPGSAGTSATVTAGTTTTLPAGSSATVTNSGTSSAAVFDFGIPKGDTGDTGPAGTDGYSPTATVTKSGDTATITITDKNGTTTAQVSDGTTPTIDSALSPTSENPVQNKVVTNALAGKQPSLQVVQTLPSEGTEGTEYFVNKSYDNITQLKGDTTQQTYTGKNKLNVSASYTVNSSDIYKEVAISATSGVSYRVSCTNITTNGTGTCRIGFNNAGGTNVGTVWLSNTNKSANVTLTGNAVSVYIYSDTNYGASQSATTTYTNLMVAEASTSTDYEPYVGGTASPNPDYPQAVNTVTGEQTVTISDGQGNEQTYPVNLGNIELCKIGTYQDYIYKSGEDWYVHKEIGKLDLSSSTSWWLSGEQTADVTQVAVWVGAIAKTDNEPAGYSNILGVETLTEWGVRKPNSSVFSGNNYYVRISSSLATTVEQWQSYLSTHTMLVYYVLRTPTDTQITNATLISELEAVSAVNIKPTDTTNVTSEYLPAILVLEQGSNSYLEPYVCYNGNFIKVE